eukprot:m.155998 g.155998  ORF g.155998 m.155998 type:complete len:330 (+) comp15093_c0_seq1:16-1005(+)
MVPDFLQGYFFCNHCPYFYNKTEECLWIQNVEERWLHVVGGNVVLILITLLSCGFALAIKRHFNHVLLIHRRVRTAAVSNTSWILFFGSTAARTSLSIGRNASQNKIGSIQDLVCFYGLEIAEGCALMFLCIALNHQRIHRSSGSASHYEEATSALKQATYGVAVNAPVRSYSPSPGKKRTIQAKLGCVTIDTLLVLEFILYVGLLLGQMASEAHVKQTIFFVYLGVLAIIHITKFVLVGFILADHDPKEEGFCKMNGQLCFIFVSQAFSFKLHIIVSLLRPQLMENISKYSLGACPNPGVSYECNHLDRCAITTGWLVTYMSISVCAC